MLPTLVLVNIPFPIIPTQALVITQLRIIPTLALVKFVANKKNHLNYFFYSDISE